MIIQEFYTSDYQYELLFAWKKQGRVKIPFEVTVQ